MTDIQLDNDGKPILICNVCEKNRAKGVCCVPGVPVSMAYCQECLSANAHPWGILVANTACVGSFADSADWWKKMVYDTIAHLGSEYTLARFLDDVAHSVVEMEQWERETRNAQS